MTPKNPIKKIAVKKAKVVADKLPKKIVINKKVYKTPSLLQGLKFKKNALSNKFKIVVYTIKKTTKTKWTLQQIADGLFKVRDNYFFKQIKPEINTFQYTLFKALQLDTGFLDRNDCLTKLDSVYKLHNYKKYRFHCFDCSRIVYAGYTKVAINIEEELKIFWLARERYLEQVDSSSVTFAIWTAYEKLTGYFLIDFSQIQMTAGDSAEFENIVRQIIQEGNYGTI